MPNNNYGVITEQGDLGLGFNPINEADKKLIDDTEKTKKATEETLKATTRNTVNHR